MNKGYATGFVFGVLFILSGHANAESASPYFESPFYQSYVQYAIHAGYLNVAFPMNQPYTCHELIRAIATNQKDAPEAMSRWNKRLVQEILRFYNPRHAGGEYGQWHLGAQTRYRLMADSEKSYTRYRIGLYGTWVIPNVVLANTTATDQAFKADPGYHGDTGEWIQGRPETAYALFQYKALNVFAGRVSRNMGISGEPGLILSDNPYSYDHFGFSVASKRVKFSFYTTRLNDMFAIDTQGDSVYQDTRRYMAVQRGDLSLLDNFKVGLSQVAVYGGPDQNFEAYYLNPLGLYYVMQRNNGVNISGLWSVDLWWKPSPPMTLYLQYLIDDIIVNNEPGQDDRAVHPDRFGVLAKAIISNSMLDGLQTGITYARVWNWTYTSYRSYENYIYHLKSLGYPLNAVEDFKLEMDYFGRPPFILHFKVGLRRHGNQSLLQPFQDTKDAFPIGTVERTGWGQVSLDYLPSPAWYVRLRLQYESIDNELNIEDRKRDYFLAQLVVGLNLWTDLK